MSLGELQTYWNDIGEQDPLWAVLTDAEKRHNGWDWAEFMATGRADVRRMLSFVADHDLPSKRGQALDFGCGVGRLTQALCTEFEQVHGVDIAPSMLRIARERNEHPGRCRYHHVEQPLRLRLPRRSFDFICSLITLQHMQPHFAAAYLTRLTRLVARGGVMLFQVPDRALFPDEAVPPPIDPETSWVRRHVVIPVEDRLRPLRVTFGLRPSGPSAGDTATATGSPTMEMHCLPEADVLAILKSGGLRVVDVVEDDAAGDQYISKRYLARR